MRALGANAVETYVAWNIHEPRKGDFDFGQGNNDFSEFANLRLFLQIAQEEDLLVLLRPGPYICTGKVTYEITTHLFQQFAVTKPF